MDLLKTMATSDHYDDAIAELKALHKPDNAAVILDLIRKKSHLLSESFKIYLADIIAIPNKTVREDLFQELEDIITDQANNGAHALGLAYGETLEKLKRCGDISRDLGTVTADLLKQLCFWIVFPTQPTTLPPNGEHSE